MGQHRLGNVKSAIAGTCRAIRPRHAERYLAAYEYKMVERLAAVAAKTAPLPYYVIAPEETSG